MSTSASEQPETIYQLTITVRGLSPLMWRRVLVRSDTTIAQLHAIMQMAMGWKDSHLHRFRIQGRCLGRLGHPFVLYRQSMRRGDSRGATRRG